MNVCFNKRQNLHINNNKKEIISKSHIRQVMGTCFYSQTLCSTQKKSMQKSCLYIHCTSLQNTFKLILFCMIHIRRMSFSFSIYFHFIFLEQSFFISNVNIQMINFYFVCKTASFFFAKQLYFCQIFFLENIFFLQNIFFA